MFSGSIVALVTPFTLDNQIDFYTLEHLIEWHIVSGTNGIVLAGTTGESATLSSDEKVALAEAAVSIAKGRLKIILGNGSNDTAASIRLTQRLNDTGIDGYLTVTPYYNKPTDAGLIAHFTAIAKATSLPIILYNVPSRTLCDMKNEIVVKLAELNNIVGIKDATADLSRLTHLKALLVTKLSKKTSKKLPKNKNFALLSGDDASSLAYCMAGGHGVISVSANVVPKVISSIQKLLKTNKSDDLQQAKLIDHRLIKLHQDLFIESNPIAVKWALYWMNKTNNDHLRLPLLSLSKTAQLSLQKTLEDSGIKQYLQEH
ncbi:MAG: 4-hydroxy-tetrahydrodipicolinate synthase [Gammaproteobacteria bacterium]|nr:MAG: 4-hydroxy-tetrahydrodipicolinate synthase [Gammaproteobacteria bacterium]